MKYLYFIVFGAFFGCKKGNPVPVKKTVVQQDTILLPPAPFAVDTTDGEQYKVVLENEDFKELRISTSELKQADILLSKSVAAYNKLHADNPVDLRYYKRQYVPAVNDKGDKEIEIHGLCVTMGDKWKKYAERVSDGGKCYFFVVVNLASNTFGELQPHGEA
jgi:hypothetical protein